MIRKNVGRRMWDVGCIVFLMLYSSTAFAGSVCYKNDCVNVEVVKKPEDLIKGLSGRVSLDQGQGMLFVFDQEDQHGFWMKDMNFDLDIIWLNKKGKIVHIEQQLKPCTPNECIAYRPVVKAKYVLEVPAGFSASKKWAKGTSLKVNDAD